ncbi:MAG: hypothetical protein WBM90_10730 [Acidimicrobiia bacterium]
MSRRNAGIVLMGLGSLLVVVGIVVWAASGGNLTIADGSTTSTSRQTTSAPATESTGPGTTTPPATTSPTPAPTTTVVDLTPDIEAFVPVFADAIGAGDADFLFNTLHPAVLAIYDEATCRAFIDSDILLLEDYRLTGPATGPETQTIATFEVDVYSGPVSFRFQGETFDTTATFAFLDNRVTWFTECA